MLKKRSSELSISMFLNVPAPRRSIRRSISREKKNITHIWNFTDGHIHLSIPYCTFCHIDFKSNIQWQAHLIAFVHKVPSQTPAELKVSHDEAIIMCKFCHQDVVTNLTKEHRCYLGEVTRLEGIIEQYNETYCPIVCVLCKKLSAFPSQANLQAHLITRHSPLRDPWRCNFCNAKFKTTTMSVHEAHVIDVHGPELNLIYWRLIGEQLKVKSKTDTVKYVCAMSYYSKFSKLKAPSCPDDIHDLFELTLHTLCYHGIIKTKPMTKDRVSTFSNKDNVICRFCGEICINSHNLRDHISLDHFNEIIIRKEFIMRKGLFLKKVSTNFTCFICISVFPSTVELQIHLMVNHGTEEFGHCGICNEDLFNYNGENVGKVDRIHWKAINYHERLHVQQYQNYINTGIFNPSLKPSAQFYISEDDFAEKLYAKNNVKVGPMFNDTQKAFFNKLGLENYETQVNMEINDK